MKSEIYLYITIAIISLISCNTSYTESENDATIYYKTTNSNCNSEQCSINEFNSITMKGVGNIIYQQADSTSIKIKGPEYLLDKITIKNQNKELYISFDPNYKNLDNTKHIYYYITSPELNYVYIKGIATFNNQKLWKTDKLEISVKGVGKINAKNIKSKKLDAKIDGTGKIKLDVDCDEINTEIKGIGKIEISGTTNTINRDIKGIGKVDISRLKIKNQ